VKYQTIDAIYASILLTMVFVFGGCAVFGMVASIPQDPQRYTVHFDGIDYQDLTRLGWNDEIRSYKTKSGKRIEFHGNFYEVEQ
jgi:hypothetical protein